MAECGLQWLDPYHCQSLTRLIVDVGVAAIICWGKCRGVEGDRASPGDKSYPVRTAAACSAVHQSSSHNWLKPLSDFI